MQIRTNSLKAWALAARPKTLAGAAAPVLMGMAMALSGGGEFRVLPFVLCLLFAFVMQIDANFINDYFDYKKGTDRDDRLGPERACAQGWVTPRAMKTAIATTTLLACATGLPLAFMGGLPLLIVGALCVVFCFLYTTSLSYLGYGDLLVLVFFGIVPVGFTFYLQTGCWTPAVTLAGIACGLATDCLLMVNNYRDCEQDVVSGKRTLVVRMGKGFGLHAYLWLGVAAVAFALCSLYLSGWSGMGMLMFVYMLLHLFAYRRMCRLEGRALNSVLGATARNIFIFALLFVIACMV